MFEGYTAVGSDNYTSGLTIDDFTEEKFEFSVENISFSVLSREKREQY